MPVELFGEADQRSLAQLTTCIEAGGGDLPAALCADHHPGYAQPIGGVIGYRHHLSISGVGYDIGCGNKAVKLPIRYDDLKKEKAKIADAIWNELSFGIGLNNTDKQSQDDPVIEKIAKANFKPQRKLLQTARNQLGTIGGGNHYVDLFYDEDGWVWIGVHFGSRGFGYKTAEGFLALAEGKEFTDKTHEGGMDVPPVLLDIPSNLGADYIEAQHLALAYAYAGRNWVCQKVQRILGVTSPVTQIHNHHNYASLETHRGENLWVVRKGATAAFPGQLGFVGGSVRDISVIVQGEHSEKSVRALYSTIHGAGRLMGRREAGGVWKFSKDWECTNHRVCKGTLPSSVSRGPDGEKPKCPECGGSMHRSQKKRQVKAGKVNFEEAKREIAAHGIELRGGNAEQTHHSYKNLGDVLQHHLGTIRIVHTLKPFVVCMADEKTPADD